MAFAAFPLLAIGCAKTVVPLLHSEAVSGSILALTISLMHQSQRSLRLPGFPMAPPPP